MVPRFRRVIDHRWMFNENRFVGESQLQLGVILNGHW